MLNDGDKVPSLTVRLNNPASEDGALVTTTVYVSIVVPSCAVTTVVIVFWPTFNGIWADGVPLATVTPFTFIVAVLSLIVGVTVIFVVELGTLSVYANVPLLNAGVNVPWLTVNFVRVASELAALVTITV